MASKIIAISGGIGAGKSMVSRILRVMGYPVYDCDSEAKRLMDNNDDLKRRLQESFGADVVKDGVIDRPLLASIVFKDAAKLGRLNEIVHGEVRNDVDRWTRSHEGIVFVETALLYQSGLDRMVEQVWDVTAPREVRILRATRRDKAQESDIIRRIESQDNYVPDRGHAAVSQIVNDGFRPLLPQILNLIK